MSFLLYLINLNFIANHPPIHVQLLSPLIHFMTRPPPRVQDSKPFVRHLCLARERRNLPPPLWTH